MTRQRLNIVPLLIALIASVLLSFMAGVVRADDQILSGAGATFPYPLYSRWAHDYQSVGRVQLNYQSIGSGGGIAQIKAKTVDFGASDKPLKAEELAKIGLTQFPTVMGGVVPVVNIKGLEPGALKLSPDVLADIYLGKITKWTDARITALNSGLKLPNADITVVHRSDGSGTTWIFTNYLTKVSEGWKKEVGCESAVQWPAGVGAKGNEGVAAQVQKIAGAIGYVEFAYAMQTKMAYTQMQNQAGKFVSPTAEAFQAAAAKADWAGSPGFYVVLTDQPGDESWPIAGATFILVYKQQQDQAKAQAVLKFFDWAFAKGDESALALHYVPMPDNVVKLIQESWAKEISAAGKPVWPAP